jgi:hypothetical protein
MGLKIILTTRRRNFFADEPTLLSFADSWLKEETEAEAEGDEAEEAMEEEGRGARGAERGGG